MSSRRHWCAEGRNLSASVRSIQKGVKRGESNREYMANLSGDTAQDYFADGMTEAMITELAQISALRVISRTSVMQYIRWQKIAAGNCPQAACG